MAMSFSSPAIQFGNSYPHRRRVLMPIRTGGKARVPQTAFVHPLRVTTKIGAGPAHSKNEGYSVRKFCKEYKELDSQASSNFKKHLLGMELGNPCGGENAPLLYKPYMDHLVTTLIERTPDLHCLPLDPDMRRQESSRGVNGSRVFNWLFAANRLRRIRLTYFDGGSSLQAFNSLLYPDFRYDVPLLGIDLLSFGASKILCVIDFIPLSQDTAYLDEYTSQLVPIRAKIAKHCGRMTTKFYDENQFFSKELIFYRSNLGSKDPVLEVPNGLLFEVYAGYLDNYLQTLQRVEGDGDPLQMAYVASRHQAYEKYSETRDPAIKLFNTYFGEEWTSKFKTFLFPATAFW